MAERETVFHLSGPVQVIVREDENDKVINAIVVNDKEYVFIECQDGELTVVHDYHS